MLALSIDFFTEAEQILAQKTPLNTLTAVSAFQLLSMVAVTHGRDDIAPRYLREGVRLGKLMGLFGVESSAASANSWVDGHHDWNVAASYTAWGVFNWLSYVLLITSERGKQKLMFETGFTACIIRGRRLRYRLDSRCPVK